MLKKKPFQTFRIGLGLQKVKTQLVVYTNIFDNKFNILNFTLVELRFLLDMCIVFNILSLYVEVSNAFYKGNEIGFEQKIPKKLKN
jgi:hypothetical protein